MKEGLDEEVDEKQRKRELLLYKKEDTEDGAGRTKDGRHNCKI